MAGDAPPQAPLGGGLSLPLRRLPTLHCATVAEARYVLRFFFDAGSGICLWAANDGARERYGYAVDVRSLPVSDGTRGLVEALLDAYDASFNWDDPGGADLWSPVEAHEFDREARVILDRLRSELGPSFEVRDELK